MYEKNFDMWNEKKKKVDKKRILESFYFHEREIWWCTLGVNIGVEIDGKNTYFERPVLIIKKFNGMMFWGIPLTSKVNSNPHLLLIHHSEGTSLANLTQLRVFSSKRIHRKLGFIDKKSFSEVLFRLKNYL
ncbi:MAG: type II toxin-antitoxin system PemK/MazF family toxin [Candidatus Gracilibacteria bacterium]|jgi:mRNA interferase MazF